MNHHTLIVTAAIALMLSACSTYVVPPIGPDEPTAELYGTGAFSMTMPQVDGKGCYQGNRGVDTQAGAAISRVLANKPLVVTIDGSVGMFRCRAMVKFKPVAGRRYVAHGLSGPDDVQGPQLSLLDRATNPNTPQTCHIEVYDETEPANAERVKAQHTKPHQSGIACNKF